MIAGSSGKKADTKKLPKDKATKKGDAEAAGKSSNIVSQKGDATIKRTMSFQNVQAPVVTPTGLISTGSLRVPVKRAQSSQNVCSPKSSGKSLKLSTPANAMAYNAELLANFEKEKKTLERRISELIQTAENRQRDNEKLKYEVKNLKEKLKEARTLLKDHQSPQSPPAQRVSSPDGAAAEEVAQLRRENVYLRQRLSELNVCLDEHFTDAEKLLMKRSKDARSDHDESSAPGSAAKNRSPSDVDSKEAEYPEFGSERRSNYSLDCNCWDRQSTKSSDGALSEMSVACLQDRILQMEETHYSTNEELQATLQELTDLQDAVNELTSENERLANERNVLLESLCTQTLKLENSRLHLNFVKSLLLRDAEASGSAGGGVEGSDVDGQLLALMKSDQEEREELLLRQVELSNKLHTLGKEGQELQEANEALQARIASIQKELEDSTREAQELQEQNALLADQLGQAQLEREKCKIVLESEQKKIQEMEQERRLMGEEREPSTVVELLRDEKEKLDGRLVSLEQELSERRFENAHLREALADLEEESRASRARADARLEERCSELEGQLQRSRGQARELEEELKVVHQHLDSLRLECDQHLDDKKTYTLTLARAESELRIWRSKAARAQAEAKEIRAKFSREQEEWQQFQEDLQRAVVIANEFKTEAQNDAERVASDYRRMQETVQALTKQLEVSKNEAELLKQQLAAEQMKKDQQEQASAVQKSLGSVEPVLMSREEIRDKVLSSVDRELASRRQVRQQSGQKLSVRHLISSIEEQMKNDGATVVSPPATSVGPSQPGVGPVSRRDEGIGGRRDREMDGLESGPTTPIKLPKRSTDMSPSSNQELSSLTSSNHFQSLNLDILQAPTATDDAKLAVVDSVTSVEVARKPLVGILTNKAGKKSEVGEGSPEKPSSHLSYLSKTDPLANLAKQLGGSKRNALLKWCQNKTASYKDIDITNFSSSWNDGLAFCALLHTYMPDKIPYKDLNPQDKMRNFAIAFKGAESVGIPQTLNIVEMATRERPDWQGVMAYVTSIYKHFELSNN